MKVNLKMNCLMLAVAALTSLSLAGCGGAKAKNGTLVLDSTGTSGGTSTTPTSANFTLSATFGYPTYFNLHNASSADWSGPCQVAATNIQYPPLNAGFISCNLEASEFDLYLSSLNLQYSAPAGSCDYLEVSPYFAWQFQPNVGASSFTKTIHADGSVTLGSIVAGNSHVTGPSVNLIGTAEHCPYDYSTNDPPGPNCCPGAYAETIISMDSSGGSTSSFTSGKWGGKIGNCAVGPGVDYATTTGIGFTTIDNVPRVLAVPATSGYAGTIAVASPLSKGFASVAYNTNYFPSASTPPAGLGGTAYTNGYGIAPQPYYSITCYTHAKEAKSRILLQIRKWNLASELAKGSAGNWNTSGVENDPQYPTHQNDDYAGWEDYNNASVSYPGLSF